MAAPSTPTITLSISGTTATVTVAGDDSVTNQLYYHEIGTDAWTTGNSRSGDGDITASSLSIGHYEFMVQASLAGENSVPSAPVDGMVGTSPVSLTEGKLHLRVESSVTADDDLITGLLNAATKWAEDFQGRKYITQTVVEKFDAFPEEFRVKYPPLISVTSIGYTDVDGNSQTVSSSVYDVDTTSERGRIALAYSQSWPSTRAVIDAVTLTYVAGYGAASSVPDTIKTAIKLLIGHWYENRESTVIGFTPAEVPMGAKELLWPLRVNVI